MAGIFIDMDGVIADFEGAVERLFGMDHGTIKALVGTGPDVYHRYDVRVSNFLRISPQDFWGFMTFNFWATMEPLPLLPKILKALEGREFYILSGPTQRGADGKLAWLKKHVPKVHRDRRWIFTHHKHMLSRIGNLLVDDSDQTIAAWKAEGGDSVLVPRYWNSGVEFINDWPPDKVDDAVLVALDRVLCFYSRR